MAGRRITQITQQTDTVDGNQRHGLRDSFVRDWDAKAGIEQALQRVDHRKMQGQKMTPIGAGKTTKGR
jgi:hypothetical protein